MSRKKSKRYPDELSFRFSGFDWTIKFLEIDTDRFGDTDTDSKEVKIYYKGKSDQNIIETLIHELVHVAVFDLADSIFHFDVDDVDKKEENLIRLTSPRIFAIMRDNPKLVDFIVKKIKEL